jgi:hypothetical protein
MEVNMAWRAGPMPMGTYWWGGIVLVGQSLDGFYFADFQGDHCLIVPGGKRVEAADVAYYNNSLMPPHFALSESEFVRKSPEEK